MITREEAVAIALRTIEGAVKISPDSTLEVEEQSDVVIVEWRRHLPPDVLGPDFDARVTIDRATGEVKEFLVGS